MSVRGNKPGVARALAEDRCGREIEQMAERMEHGKRMLALRKAHEAAQKGLALSRRASLAEFRVSL